jgi:hypothetical protein
MYQDNIPRFELESASEIETFMAENRLMISELILEAIKKALKQGILDMPIMKLVIHDLPVAIVTVKRDSFNDSLSKCLKYFEEAEEYEKCAEIMKMLKNDLDFDVDLK